MKSLFSSLISSRYLAQYQAQHSYHGESKKVVITGTTTGMGKALTRIAIGYGIQVIMLNRPSERVHTLLASLPQDAKVHAFDCDLTSFDSVQKAADQVLSVTGGCVDALINNAGIMALSKEATIDGYERQMQVNHLSHFLLTKRLWPALQYAAEHHGDARVINHSSSAGDIQKNVKLRFLSKDSRDWGDDSSGMVFKQGGRWLRYAQSKLANQYFTKALDSACRRVQCAVRAIAVQPGLAQTMLQPRAIRDGGMHRVLNHWMFRCLGQSCEDGALPMLHAMLEPDCASGMRVDPQYYMFGLPKVSPLALRATNEQLEAFWLSTEQAVGEGFTIT